MRHRTNISRLERLLRKPKLYAALACQIVFDVLPHQMFPRLYALVQEAVLREAKLLSAALSGRSGKPAERKRKLLENVIARIKGRNHRI